MNGVGAAGELSAAYVPQQLYLLCDPVLCLLDYYYSSNGNGIEMSPRLLHPLLIFLTFISHCNLETFFAKPFFHLLLIMKYFRNFDMTNLEK